MTRALRIIVTGLIGQHPLGGVTWDYVQYPVGLSRLGHDVWYLEDSGEWPYDVSGRGGRASEVYDCSANVSRVAEVMQRFGMSDRWMYRCPIGSEWFGVDEERRRDVIASADILLNISGTLVRPWNYRSVRRLVYVDTDPVFTQIKLVSGGRPFQRRTASHDMHFSFGECLNPSLPDGGFEWRPTRQPVLLDQWDPATPSGPSYTTIMNWASYAAVKYDGITYGQKNVEFRRFIDLPRRLPEVEFEVAVKPTERRNKPTAPIDRLRQHGWNVVDPLMRCGDLDSYRSYIESSRAEWSVAKNGYVVGRPGWFSCRSACYLAAGRPVVVQDTGFTPVIPVGRGVLTFASLDEAVRAVADIESDYEAHRSAARSIAETYFDAGAVLTSLVDEVMGERW